MVKVDSFFGGQVFRNSIGLSALLQKEIKVTNIRGHRETAGLGKQHLTGLDFLRVACNARVFGAKIGSKDIAFKPNEFSGGEFSLNVGSAGSICLVLQSLLLPSMKKQTRLKISGGTDVPFAPPINFFVHEFFPILRKMHANFDLKIVNRGYYPKGGGLAIFSSKPLEKFEGINLSVKKPVDNVKIFCHSSGLPVEVTKTMGLTAKKKLEENNLDCEIVFDVSASKESVGCGIEVFGFTKNSVISRSALGRKGLPAEKVAVNAVNDFLLEVNSNACVDVFTSDQLIPFMALAKGKSVFSVRLISHHLKESIHVVEQFLPVKFEIKEKNNLFFVSVDGADFFNSQI